MLRKRWERVSYVAQKVGEFELCCAKGGREFFMLPKRWERVMLRKGRERVSRTPTNFMNKQV